MEFHHILAKKKKSFAFCKLEKGATEHGKEKKNVYSLDIESALLATENTFKVQGNDSCWDLP